MAVSFYLRAACANVRTPEPIQHFFQHNKGINHGKADALSRYPLKQSECDRYTVRPSLSDLPCSGCNHCMNIHLEWSQFHSDIDDVKPFAVKSDSSLVLLENQTNHRNSSCDVSDTRSGGHSVPKQDKETETVCQITSIDEFDDKEK